VGIPVEGIACSDLKQSYDMASVNFQSLQAQIHGGCLIHPHVGRLRCPDLACTGTPCQPFSRQRTKRSTAGSVVGGISPAAPQAAAFVTISDVG
jgi:hypothetical protein